MAWQKAWKARDATKRQLDFSTEFLGAAWKVAGERHRYKTKGGGGKAGEQEEDPNREQGRDSTEGQGQCRIFYGEV